MMKPLRRSVMTRRCKPMLLWLTHLAVAWLPSTRFFSLKRRLLWASGVGIAPGARLCSSVRIVTSGTLEIGTDTFIGHEVLIAGGDSAITIGSYCDIAPRVMLVSGSHEIASTGPRAAGTGYSRPIVVEDGVWIGSGSIILGGVRIGQRSVIGAGSVVVTDIPANCVAFGSPCRVRRHILEEAALPTEGAVDAVSNNPIEARCKLQTYLSR
jgi:maltose O-acetyltransferase